MTSDAPISNQVVTSAVTSHSILHNHSHTPRVASIALSADTSEVPHSPAKRAKSEQTSFPVGPHVAPISQPSASNPSLNSAVTNTGSSSNMSTSNTNAPNENKIDEGLYSRQLYVLGHEAMRRLGSSAVLVAGMGGLGVEIAKNVTLAGVGQLVLQDTRHVTIEDLSTNFFLTDRDVKEKRNRAEAVLPHISSLNSYVRVTANTSPLTKELLKNCSVVIVTNPGDEGVAGDENEWLFKLDAWCREAGAKLIVVDTRGLFGQVFVDLGDQFSVVDSNGEQPAQFMLANIEKAEVGLVHVADDARHGLEDGDHVTFSEVKGLTGLNGCDPRPIKVVSKCSFSIGDIRGVEGEYIGGGLCRQVKQPKVLSFKSMRESSRDPKFCETDLGKLDRPAKLHLAFAALHAFRSKHRRLPKAYNDADAKELIDIARGLSAENADDLLLRIFSYVCAGQLSPMCSALGGMAAQEALKASTGKFSPIYQWLYFDALECLPDGIKTKLPESSVAASGTRYDAQVAVFGKEYQQKLCEQKVFVVGAGAIGCELLKSIAMMGVGCKPPAELGGGARAGRVTVTDMDKIERSNLNRQFLFRSWNVGHAKSTAASAAVQHMNPALQVDALELRVGAETESTFNDSFFAGLDCVVNALDNVEARRYMDSRCVFYEKPLLESGTMGPKCNVQVVVPHLTESYGVTYDPPEKGIMLCTLKHFPNAIEHTIQWAREEFDAQFVKQSTSSVQYRDEPGYMQRLKKGPLGVATLETLGFLKGALSTPPTSFKDCMRWARLLFESHYRNAILQLLHNFPPNHVTSEGVPFWSPPKRLPKPLVFDPNVPLHLQFIEAGARVRAFMFGLTAPAIAKTDEEQAKLCAELVRVLGEIEPTVPPFEPASNVRIETSDSEFASAEGTNEDIATRVSEILGKMPTPAELKSRLPGLQVVEFEKDDDSNFHIEFIAAASNLRAANYGIESADKHKTKGIAGRIIPAIATTTALVVGLVSLEYYKLVTGHKQIEQYRNAFINLALPYFGFSEPVPPVKKEYCGKAFTQWDRIVIDANLDGAEMTLQQFFDAFKAKTGLKIAMLSVGQVLLYSFFMDPRKKADRLNNQMSATLRKLNVPFPRHVRTLVVEVCCNDDANEEVDVPPIHYVLPSNAPGYEPL